MRELLLDTYSNLSEDLFRGWHTGCLVICPKCGKDGFLTRRWVRANGTYFPEVSAYTLPVENYFAAVDHGKRISPIIADFVGRHLQNLRVFEKSDFFYDREKNEEVHKYVCTFDPNGRHSLVKAHYIRVKSGDRKSITDKKRIFQVLGKTWRREIRYYVGHYDQKKYQEKLMEFKLGKLKWRPNGRTWCLMNRDVFWNNHGSSRNLYEERSWVA